MSGHSHGRRDATCRFVREKVRARRRFIFANCPDQIKSSQIKFICDI